MKTFLPAAAVGLGVVLLVGSALWAIVFPASRGWTEEKSSRMTELGNRASEIDRQLQQPPSMHAGVNPAELKAERDKIDVEYKQLYEEFSGVSEAPKTASRFLRWSGIAFIVAGALIVFANRSA